MSKERQSRKESHVSNSESSNPLEEKNKQKHKQPWKQPTLLFQEPSNLSQQ